MTENVSEIDKDSVFEDEINLIEVFKTLWEGKYFIIICTAVISIGSIFYSLSLPNYFTSEALLIVRDTQKSGSLSQSLGVNSFMGINLSGNSSGDSIKIMEIVKSREFVKHLMTFEDVLPSLIAAKRYDPSSKQLFFDPETYDLETKSWVREASLNLSQTPSYLEAHKAYHEMISISQDKMTGLITISMEHLSPIFAENFLNLIINEANNLNRQIDINDTSKALKYLEQELASTSLVEIKKSINQLVEAQLETKMMASIHEEYSLVTIEPPFVPEKKSRPVRSLIVIFATILGGIFSVIVVILRHYFIQNKH